MGTWCSYFKFLSETSNSKVTKVHVCTDERMLVMEGYDIVNKKD